MQSPRISWPGGKRFAFTVFDDSDATTEFNGPPVYELLRDLGFRTTKSVWPISSRGEVVVGGETCENPAYLEWARKLQSEGFEIAMHNASRGTSTREETMLAFAKFHEYFGQSSKSLTNHVGNSDAIYWGSARLSGWRRGVYRVLTRGRSLGSGHVEGDPLFWGDLCRSHVTYVRNFVFNNINVLNRCPFMPYHDPDRPWVNRWFSSAEGGTLEDFNRMLCEANQDRLEQEGGCCIMYAHFGKSFFANGRVDPEFSRLMQRLSAKNGWFAPVSEVLDWLEKQRGYHVISRAERARMETAWLMHKIFTTQGSS